MDGDDRLAPALYAEFKGLHRARPAQPPAQQVGSAGRGHRRKRGDHEEVDEDEWEEIRSEDVGFHEPNTLPGPAKRQRTTDQGYNYAQRLPTRPPPPPSLEEMASIPKPPGAGPAAKAAGAAYYSLEDAKDAYDRLKYAIPTAEGYVGVGPGPEIDVDTLRGFEPDFARAPPFDNARKMEVYDKVTKLARNEDKGPFSTQWFETDAAKRDALHAVPLYDSMLLLAAKFAAPNEEFFIQRPDMREFIHWVEDGMRDLEKERVMRRALSSDAQKIEQEVASETRNFQVLFTDIATKALPSLASDGTGRGWEMVRDQLRGIEDTPTTVVDNILQSSTTPVAQRKGDVEEFAKYKESFENIKVTRQALNGDATELLRKVDLIVTTMAKMVQFSPTATLFAYLNTPPAAKSQVTRWAPPPGMLQIDAKNMDLLRASANWKPLLAPLAAKQFLDEQAIYQYSKAEVDTLLRNLFSISSANGFGEVGSEDGLGLDAESAVVLGEVLHLNRLAAEPEVSKLFVALAQAIAPTRKIQEAAAACANLMAVLLAVPPIVSDAVPAAPAPVVVGAPAEPPVPAGVVALAKSMWKSLMRVLSPAPAPVPAPAAGPGVAPPPIAPASIEPEPTQMIKNTLPDDMVAFLKTGIEIERSLKKIWDLNLPWLVDARLLAVREFFSYEYVRTTLLALVTLEIQVRKKAAQQRRERIASDMKNLASTDFIGRILAQQELRRKFMRMYWHSRQPHLQPTFAISGRARVIIDLAEEAIRRLGGDWVYFDSGPVIAHFWIDTTEKRNPKIPQACSFREVFLSFMHFMEREREPLNGITRRSAYESKAMVIREMNEKAKLLRYIPRAANVAEKYPPYHPQIDRNMDFHPDHILI